MQKFKITLYSCSDQIRSAIRTAFKGAAYEVYEITDSVKGPRVNINETQQPGTFRLLKLPERVDYVVTTATLNRQTEKLAADLALLQKRNDVYAVVLPEAMDWLRDQLAKRGELILVGSDQAG